MPLGKFPLILNGESGGNEMAYTAYVGISDYITGTQYLQQIKDYMESHGMNIIRISFREGFLGAGTSRSFNRDYVDWFITNTDYMIIIEPNHIYPPNESGAQTFRDHIDEVEAHLINIAQMYANNPRIILEPFNEYVSNDLWTWAQHFIDLLRQYTNCPILTNKWYQNWKKLNDPLNKDMYSYHFYFNSWSVNDAYDNMQEAINAGIYPDQIINTEMGADYNEESAFSVSEVQEVNEFIQMCAEIGIGNCIWMYQNIQNGDTYDSMGLTIPDINQDNGGEENMVNVVFDGTVLDKDTNAGLVASTGIITIIAPDSTEQTIGVSTDGNGVFSTNIDLTLGGTYSASAVFSLSEYNDGVSNTVEFTVMKDMVVSLNVSVG